MAYTAAEVENFVGSSLHESNNLEHMYVLCLFFWRDSPPVGPWPPQSRGFYITHNDALQSVGILWTSDQLVAETST